MLGDKVKRMCDHILSIRLTNEGTKHKAREAMEDLNELLQYKEKYEELKEDAELGKALNLAFEHGLRVTDYMGGLGIHVSLEDEDQLLEWYNENKGDE